MYRNIRLTWVQICGLSWGGCIESYYREIIIVIFYVVSLTFIIRYIDGALPSSHSGNSNDEILRI